MNNYLITTVGITESGREIELLAICHTGEIFNYEFGVNLSMNDVKRHNEFSDDKIKETKIVIKKLGNSQENNRVTVKKLIEKYKNRTDEIKQLLYRNLYYEAMRDQEIQTLIHVIKDLENLND